MSHDDPKFPFDPAPPLTPELLQREVAIDRRGNRGPTFEDLRTAPQPPPAVPPVHPLGAPRAPQPPGPAGSDARPAPRPLPPHAPAAPPPLPPLHRASSSAVTAPGRGTPAPGAKAPPPVPRFGGSAAAPPRDERRDAAADATRPEPAADEPPAATAKGRAPPSPTEWAEIRRWIDPAEASRRPSPPAPRGGAPTRRAAPPGRATHPPPSVPEELMVTQPSRPPAELLLHAAESAATRPMAPDDDPTSVERATLDPSSAAPADLGLSLQAPPAMPTDATVMAAPASLLRRLVAYLVDLAAVAATTATFLAGALLVVGAPGVPLLDGLSRLALPGVLLAAVLSFTYATVFAVLFQGRTLGRSVAGLRLVDGRGATPTPVRATLRAALSLASFALFLSGFWLGLLDRRGQTLHDKLTGTFVVRLLDR